jgi:hypothetical protein
MESNIGYTELHDLLVKAGDRSKVGRQVDVMVVVVAAAGVGAQLVWDGVMREVTPAGPSGLQPVQGALKLRDCGGKELA